MVVWSAIGLLGWPDLGNIKNSVRWCWPLGLFSNLTHRRLIVVMLYVHMYMLYSHSYVCMFMEPILVSLSCLSQSSLSPHLESPSLVSPSEHATREQCLPGEQPTVPFQFQGGCSGTQNCQMSASAKGTWHVWCSYSGWGWGEVMIQNGLGNRFLNI